jgi:hypothetical protein
MADHVKEFFDSGGSLELPPHSDKTIAVWLDVARRSLNEFPNLPPEKRTFRLRQGLFMMWGAIESESCIGALFRGELAGAVGYRRTPAALDRVLLGTRQAIKGAGMALSMVLAYQAIRFELPVQAVYTPDSRQFHEMIGRRLDHPGKYDSRWTLEDCQFIVGKLGGLL